jgi:hypothetical protein
VSAIKWVKVASGAGRAWKWAWSVGPGLAGAAGLSSAAGGLVQTFAGAGGVWAGVGLASVFMLIIDLKGN